MDNHSAILKAQEMIRFPIKDKQMIEWVVEYRSGNTRTIEECRTVYRLVKAMYNN